MKKTLIALLFLIGFINVSAQTAGWPGHWKGKLNVGVELTIIFHIQRTAAGTYTATADSPDQGANGMRVDSVFVSDSAITLQMPSLNAAFTGKLVNDSTLAGFFTQRASVPLVLVRTGAATRPSRPQTPVGPFPYRSEDVEFGGATGLRYGGTITIPPGKGPFPAAVLITGSGPQDRNEEIMGHQTFAVLADALTRNGLVVLRVDDRGVGKTTGIYRDATSKDFGDDASAALDYLLLRPETDRKKTGLIGHSEGGLIAPMVANARKDLDFVVLLAAPGIPVTQLMQLQNAAIMKSAGLADTTINSYLPLYRQLMDLITSGKDSASTALKAKAAIDSFVSVQDPAVIAQLDLGSEQNRAGMLKSMTGFAGTPWFRYFYRFDPQPYLEHLKVKVLAINGGRDIQVLPAQNLEGIRSALARGKVKTFTVKEIPGLNHLFQTCRVCSIPEYGTLEETFSPVALQEINTWINEHIK